ncbi:PTS glucose transporter subunit IIA [Clostridium sp.]|uniref:PTS sugar transporter subunit IIA n=1 Tax=Clostridium sp. TaxID=1506 RepID=UPI001D1DC1C4|nr:PTS glucose transporter subunit IIA [Clostridium sp.]MBS5986654.1 PTS glucose transporter subunit IIA [Clostridium sp.]
MFEFLKKESNEIVAPISGTCIKIEETPDKVFSSKMMGDGFAIIPSSDLVCAPIDGTIEMIASTKHAFGIKNKKDIEILVHIGLDTVDLEGKGFEVLVSTGTKVKRGTPIIKFDSSFMKENNKDMTTMVIFTSDYDKPICLEANGKEINKGDVLIP